MSTSPAVNRAAAAPLSSAPAQSPSSLAVTSQPGDSLKSVAERYGVSPEQMAKANPGIADADRPLPWSARVSVPVGDAAGQAKAHALAPGESVADVARAAGVSEAALREANGFGAGQAIYPNTPLLLPALVKPKGGDPADPNALLKAFPSLDKIPQEKLARIRENLGTLRAGDFAQKLEATAELAKDLPPAELPKLLQQAGVADRAIVKLATDKDALEAVSKLADPKSSSTDRVAAALTLGNSIGGLAPGKLGDALKPYLGALPAGAKLADAIGKYLDPNASALDKAKATLDLANASKDSVGNAFPQLTQKLRATDSFSRSLGAGLTLADPNASPEDKAKAAVELTANVPELRGDARRIGEFLKNGGVPKAEDVVREVERLPTASQFSDEVKKSIRPEVAGSLTRDEADKLNKLAANPELKEGLAKTLKELKDPAATRALLSSLDGAGDDAAKKALLGTLSGLKEGVADRLLSASVDGKPASEVLAKLTRELGPEGRDGLVRLVKDFDGDALKALLRFADKTDAKALEGVLKLGFNSQGASTALKALDKILLKAGVAVSPDIAARALRGVAKLAPVVGGVAAAYSAVELGKVAADAKLPPSIRFLALSGAKLNAGDAALGIFDFAGVPAVVGGGLAVAELGIELVVQDQKAKFEAGPSGYRAPEWLDALNVGLAVGQQPPGSGLREFTAIYGAKGSVQALGATVRTQASLAAYLAKTEVKAQVSLVGDGLQLTATGLHQLADVLRNPGKYGDAAEALGKAAVGRLTEAGASLGALGKAARTELEDAVQGLAKEGVDGVAALGWIASHPGAAAQKAASALGDLAGKGIDRASKEGDDLAAAALGALGDARSALAAVGQRGSAAYASADQAVRGAVDDAVSKGKQGIDTLGWIAARPGEAGSIAQDALVGVASKSGEFARQAYDEVVRLGAKGVEATQQIAGTLAAAGDDGLAMLAYVARNPGYSLQAGRQIALDGLKRIAQGAGDLAKTAARELAGLVDEGYAQAQQTVRAVLLEGGNAAKEIAQAWSEKLSPSAAEVIDGLKDLGDALTPDNAKNALSTLADAGIGVAKDLLDSVFGLKL